MPNRNADRDDDDVGLRRAVVEAAGDVAVAAARVASRALALPPAAVRDAVAALDDIEDALDRVLAKLDPAAEKTEVRVVGVHANRNATAGQGCRAQSATRQAERIGIELNLQDPRLDHI